MHKKSLSTLLIYVQSAKILFQAERVYFEQFPNGFAISAEQLLLLLTQN